MRKTFIHFTENNNLYLYVPQYSFSMLIHPELEKVHNESIEINPYYLKKYEYLKEYGFFDRPSTIDFSTTLEESFVKENINQTRQIVFETTDHCNLSCSYCSLGELYNFGKKDRKNINTRYAINFLKYIFHIKSKNSKLIISFFGGEPLVNSDFIKKIVEMAKQLNIEKKLDLEFNMTTNATLIHRHIQFLVENNFVLLISLDGNENGHSYRTFAKNNKNSFQKTVENVDMILNSYPEYFAKKVDFNAVLSNRNSIKDIYEFIYNRYNKIPRIAQINASDISPSKKDLFEKMFRSKRKSEEEFQREESMLLPITHKQLMLYRELGDFLNNFSINFYISNLLYLFYDQINPFPTGTCFPFQRKIFLNTHHNLLPCEKVSYKYSMGKATSDVVFDLSEIVKRYNFYYNHFKKVCKNCYANRSCSICLLTLDNLEKLGTEEFACSGFQDEAIFKNKLKRVFSFLEQHPSDFFQIIDNVMIERYS